jgi:hypothetical protein
VLHEQSTYSGALAILPDREALDLRLVLAVADDKLEWPMTVEPSLAANTRSRARYVLTAAAESSANADRSESSSREPSNHSIFGAIPIP